MTKTHGHPRYWRESHVCGSMPHIQAPPFNKNGQSNIFQSQHTRQMPRRSVRICWMLPRRVGAVGMFKHQSGSNTTHSFDLMKKTSNANNWLGHINLGDSNDEILMVTENRVLSKRIKDWVKVTVS